MSYESLGKGIVKRSERRVLGLFIDGTSLDRATRRLARKVDMQALVRGVTSGSTPVVARYYTLIPNDDDSRQRAFLDAVARAGLSVIVKRLPPKGVSRQVSIDLEMASDIVAFSLGRNDFGSLNQYLPETGFSDRPEALSPPTTAPAEKVEAPDAATVEAQALSNGAKTKRIVTVVCPSRDLSYPLSLVKSYGVDTVSADFGQFNAGDVLKSAAKWIDLSDSETIWRE